MSQLTVMDKVATMSSLEIAELTGKRHDNVMADIRRILDEVGISAPKFSGVYKNQQGRDTPCFNLPRRECDLVIAGYSAVYRLAIIDRWHELETKQATKPQFKLPGNYIEALEALLESEKQRALEAPKVRLATLISESSNARCIRVWVKTMKNDNNLCVGEQEVFKYLVDKKYIFKPRGENGYLPYSRHESTGTGFFTVVVDEINGKPRRMLKITGKGVLNLTAKIVDYFNNSDLAAA